MRCQVEDHVDVMLVEAQVQPGGVQVVQVTEPSVPHHVAQAPDRRVVLEGVPHHQDHAGRLRGVHHRPGSSRRRGQWLLDEHVLAGGDGLQGKSLVRARRRGDHDGVDVGQRLRQARRPPQTGEVPDQGGVPVRTWVDHGHRVDRVQRTERSDMLRAPVAAPGHPDA